MSPTPADGTEGGEKHDRYVPDRGLFGAKWSLIVNPSPCRAFGACRSTGGSAFHDRVHVAIVLRPEEMPIFGSIGL